MLAVVRPDEVNLPLLLHVLGAMVLVGTLILAAAALFVAWRDGSEASLRLGFRALVIGTLPSWLVMRVSGQWVASEQGLEDAELAWIEIGYMTGDTSLLLILISVLLAWLAVRRSRRAEGAGGTGRAAAVLVSVLLVAFVVTTWVMAAKPV